MLVKVLFQVWLFALVTLLADPATAERRVALVIGNSAYAKVPTLANPTNDAGAIEALLKKAGFDKVVRADNLGAVQMRRVVRDFSDDVRDADIAVVFYAGHGMEMNGTNYLIPVDAALERDIDVADEAVSLERINQVLEPAKRLRLIILDACRDNPFARSIRRTLASRSIGRGLAPVEVATTDTLIAFAAKAGSTAADGEAANSPYTSALVVHLATPGLDVRLALGRVRDQVLRTTNRRQEPFIYGSLGGSEVFLNPRGSPQSPQSHATQVPMPKPLPLSPPTPTPPATLNSLQRADAAFDEAARQANMGNIKRALSGYEEALRLYETAPNRSSAEVMRKVAGTYERIGALSDGDTQKTCQLYVTARRIYGELGDKQMVSQTEFAMQFSNCPR